MSLPPPPVPDPHADPLVASALRAADGGEAGACPDAELVALCAERELDRRAHADVEAHVQGCARCQAMVTALVRAMPDEAAVGAAGVPEASAGDGFAAWFTGWRWLVPAASLTAMTVVAVWVGRGPADEVAMSSRIADGGAARDQFVAPSPTSAGKAAAEPPGTGGSREAAAKTLERAIRPRPAVPAAAADARTETSGLMAERAGRAEAAASGARPAPSEQRAENEALRQRASAAAAPPPSPAAESPAPAAAPMFRANLTAASWRVRQGVIERTRDDVAWERVAAPAGATVIAVASVSVDVCWAITTDAVFVVTDGVTWTRTARPPAGPLTNVSATSARAATVTAGGTRFVTTDGGATWTPVR